MLPGGPSSVVDRAFGHLATARRWPDHRQCSLGRWRPRLPVDARANPCRDCGSAKRSRSSGPTSASNTLKMMRHCQLRWVISHYFRTTVATLMDEAGLSAHSAADQLGHAKPSLTADIYMGRKKRGRPRCSKISSCAESVRLADYRLLKPQRLAPTRTSRPAVPAKPRRLPGGTAARAGPPDSRLGRRPCTASGPRLNEDAQHLREIRKATSVCHRPGVS